MKFILGLVVFGLVALGAIAAAQSMGFDVPVLGQFVDQFTGSEVSDTSAETAKEAS